MLFPLGILSEVFFKAKWMLISSITTSLFIETLQFITRRGSAALDDLLHNTIGMMLGYCILNIVLIVFKKRESHKKIVKYLILPAAVSFVALGIIISYQTKEFGNLPIIPETNMDMSGITIKTNISLDKNPKKMPFYKYKKNSTEQIKIKDIFKRSIPKIKAWRIHTSRNFKRRRYNNYYKMYIIVLFRYKRF